jgi:hypothetical protein
MNPAFANGKPCEGCGNWILFKRDNQGKLRAYDRLGSEHQCPNYANVKRLTSDGNLIEAVKTHVALANSRLRRWRIEVEVKELRPDD